jgi:hypothetical protein
LRGVSKDRRKHRPCGHPSRLALKKGEHLRMTAVSGAAASRPGHDFSRVIAGLDPAIHPLRKSLASKMDTRVNPAYDAARDLARAELAVAQR